LYLGISCFKRDLDLLAATPFSLEDDVKTEAKFVGKPSIAAFLQGKKSYRLLAIYRSWDTGRDALSLSASRRSQFCKHTDFKFLAS
jgi:hypothetical protein